MYMYTYTMNEKNRVGYSIEKLTKNDDRCKKRPVDGIQNTIWLWVGWYKYDPR